MGKIIRDTGSIITAPIPTTGTTTLTSIIRNIDDKELTLVLPPAVWEPKDVHSNPEVTETHEGVTGTINFDEFKNVVASANTSAARGDLSFTATYNGFEYEHKMWKGEGNYTPYDQEANLSCVIDITWSGSPTKAQKNAWLRKFTLNWNWSRAQIRSLYSGSLSTYRQVIGAVLAGNQTQHRNVTLDSIHDLSSTTGTVSANTLWSQTSFTDGGPFSTAEYVYLSAYRRDIGVKTEIVLFPFAWVKWEFGRVPRYGAASAVTHVKLERK